LKLEESVNGIFNLYDHFVLEQALEKVGKCRVQSVESESNPFSMTVYCHNATLHCNISKIFGYAKKLTQERLLRKNLRILIV